MKASTKKYVFTGIAAIFCAFTSWLAGFDFDNTGFMVAWCFVMACFVCAGVYTFPGYEDDE